MKNIFTLLAFTILFAFAANIVNAQANVLDPNDPDVVFTSSNQPDQPAWNNDNIVKWGHKARLSWNPYSKGYKSYYYQNMVFRLKFPKTYQHNVNDGKKYPLFIFFLGRGEAGDIYDNEYQLLHGGELHANRVNDGTFDGFLFYAQSTTGNSQDYFPRISNMIDSLVNYVKVDVDRVIVSGLSAGGQASWDFVSNAGYARKTAACLPISAASTNYPNYYDNFLTIPIWTTNGGQDAAPAPYTVDYVVNSFRARGGNIRQTYFPSLGHGVWNSFWAEPDYFPFLNVQHKANPLVYFQRSEFCPGETVSVKLALQPGFYAYQWDKNGSVITSAVSNELNVNSFGTYRGRFKRTATSSWSDWSPIPVAVSEKQATLTPPIQINGIFSSILPSVDGKTTTPLIVPGVYSAYEWRRISDNTLVNSTSTFDAPIGSYKVKVTEQFGCSSSFSDPFNVIAALGTNVPDNITNFNGAALSNTSVQLDWNDNPTPVYNETGFEIYRSTISGSGYKMVTKTAADVLTYVDASLQSNITYYYKIRAVNNNGAAPVSNELPVTTKADILAPTAPLNLRVTQTSMSSVSLAWDESTDDVGVYKYDIYINGAKAFITENTSIVAGNLDSLQTYSFFVRARDLAGNASPKSNQVSAITAFQGLNYKYYQGSWDALPDFNTLTPVTIGTTPNVDISISSSNDNFGFLWEGYITVPTTGSYTFETRSDDGSKLYIGTYNQTSTALVDNDGLHGAQSRTGTITLAAGSYPIAITFFEKGGGELMEVFWQSTAAGISRQKIPGSAFTDNVPIPPSALPNAPSSLMVTAGSFKRINLTWTDNSNNETGFEIVRSTSIGGTYIPVGTTDANVTSYADTAGLSPSTIYWYKIRAINQSGQSDFITRLKGAWGLNAVYNDVSGNNNNLSAGSYPAFSTTDKKEGLASLYLNGSNQYADMPFSANRAFPSNSYNTRTFAAWVKPNSSTLTSSNELVVDMGGSDNGLSLRFNSGSLQAGIASDNIRQSAVLNNVASNSSWVSGGWNHVAVVYNVNVLKLFVNGVEKASTNLPFSSVGSSTNRSRLGATNSSNAFNSSTSNTNFGGLIDDVNIFEEPMAAPGLLALMNQAYGSATTLNAPAPPAAPTAISATALTTESISFVFADNSNNETGFEIFRSVGNTNNFKILTSLPAGVAASVNYTDNNLFANTTYYYKVKALGEIGESAFSGIVSATTLNNAPVFTSVANFSMRFDAQKTQGIEASDEDVEVLSITPRIPLPSFVVLNTTGNGLANLILNPGSSANQGTYPVSLVVTDSHNGKDTLDFTFVVNSNYTPVIASISHVTMNEGASNNFAISATDQDGNSTLTWALTTAPSFVSLVDNGNGAGSITMTPGYAHSGTYTVTVTVSDGAGGVDNKAFTLTVNEFTPVVDKVYMSMKYFSPDAPAPWNNIGTPSNNNLLNSNGQTTNFGIDFLDTSWNASDAGAVTGNNSGVYPDAVIKDYFWFGAYGAPETINVNLKGLNTSSKYNITIFGSSAWTGLGNNGTTIYTINGVQKPLYVDNNQQNTVTFSSIVPNASGIITLNLSKGAATPYGLVNAIVIENSIDDGTAPVLPTNLVAQALSNGTVRLSWKDVAYNEDNYLVYRATNIAGPFTLLNAGATNANDSTYIDATSASNTTYYYKIEATNVHGTSGQTPIVSVTMGNKAPSLNAINDLIVKAGNNAAVNINAIDDATDVLTVTFSGLPSFASYQSTGNGKGNINFAPTANDLGIYPNVVVTVTDNSGASVSRSFKVSVIDNDVRSVYVNFGVPGGTAQAAPWNNFMIFPYANSSLSSLKDDANVTTSFSVKLLQQWDGNFAYGMVTGENKGIFPDNVLSTSFYTTSTAARSIQIGGLNPAKRYNIAFLSSHNAGPGAQVTFVNGVQTVTSESRYNSNKSEQLNGIAPTSGGTITVTATKAAGASYLNLNALVIQEYDVSLPVVRPFYLFAESILDANKVKLTWADRSANETGFRIYRSTLVNGTYTLVTTTAAKVTTYTDNGVSPNIRYFYKVMAVNGGQLSNYSNIASIVLAPKQVYINFNANSAQNAGTPWNNTNGPSVEGATFSNLADNASGNSGYQLEITKEFNGTGFAGATGAGIFPSNVMESNYWTDAGQLSQVKFSNLDIRKKYRIGCFGSAIFQGYSFANYTCNGKTVQLNSFTNNSKVVYLDNLVSEDGELIVDVRTADGSPYSFTGAFTIEAYDDLTPYDPPSLNGTNPSITPDAPAGNGDITARNITVNNAGEAVFGPALPAAEELVADAKPNISVFPNPFTNRIDVAVNSNKPAAVTVMLYDLNSRLVYKSASIQQQAGVNKISINLPTNASLLPGSYLVSIMIDSKLVKTVKLIKVN